MTTSNKKAHLRLWCSLGDYVSRHPCRNGGLFRADGSDRGARDQSRRTKKALRRMASVAASRITMTEEERERRATAFASPLTREERVAAMRHLFGRRP